MIGKKSTDKNTTGEPRQPRGRRSRTADENLRMEGFKWLQARAENDPQMQERIIAWASGIDISNIDRMESLKLDLKMELFKRGVELIKKDPEMMDKLARKVLYELMEIEDPDSKPRQPLRPRKDPLEEAIKTAENLAKFRSAMGYREPNAVESIITSLLNPETLRGIQSLIIASRKQSDFAQSGDGPLSGANKEPHKYGISDAEFARLFSPPVDPGLPPTIPPEPGLYQSIPKQDEEPILNKSDNSSGADKNTDETKLEGNISKNHISSKLDDLPPG
jgi:hypothetical protein